MLNTRVRVLDTLCSVLETLFGTHFSVRGTPKEYNRAALAGRAGRLGVLGTRFSVLDTLLGVLNTPFQRDGHAR